MRAQVARRARTLILPTSARDLAPPPSPHDVDVPGEASASRLAFGPLPPGETLDPAAREAAGYANITRAAELQNQFLDRQREILHTGPDAFLNTTGRDALLGADDALARLEAARQETLDQAGTETQRRLLREALGAHRTVEYATVGDHIGRQTRAWRHATAAARLDQLHRQAALDHADPGAIEALHAASDSTFQELARTRPWTGAGAGILPEPGDTPSIWRIAIEAALGKFDYPSSIVLHARAGERIDPSERVLLDPLIAAAREHLAGQDYLNGLALPDTHDLDALEAAHQAATTQNESDWPDNPSQRATNQHFIDVAFGTRKREALKARAERDRAVTDWLAQPAPDGGPQTRRPPLTLWTKLDPQQQRETDIVLAQNAGGSPDAEHRAKADSRRGTAPNVEPPPGSPDYERATRELLPEVADPFSGLAHWLFGRGEPVRYRFDDIDTSSVRPEQFSEVQRILNEGKPGTYKIEGTKPFWAGNRFNSRFFVGNITLKMDGKLVLREDGSYSFEGKLSALPDRYRMYGGSHRKEIDEDVTRIGEALGSLGHRDYTVFILGEKPISSSGKHAR
ncbi:Colicin M [Enhydrobacter aerosaccus]|uniref:Colicin M n=1 Tax=Enhydrobacter aerosaccus TaxID=225324 RepID=A0A1T4SQU4_9HYPH|nr:lipid II-degrading bacteriocin [Enhydrobacter aerosaccus]SKA30605.1 Colicin M [Enhydrobacter aerosaccus]